MAFRFDFGIEDLDNDQPSIVPPHSFPEYKASSVDLSTDSNASVQDCTEIVLQDLVSENVNRSLTMY